MYPGGASVEHTDSDGWTALMHASYWGRTEVVALLFEKGARLEKQNVSGSTALALCVLEWPVRGYELSTCEWSSD